MTASLVECPSATATLTVGLLNRNIYFKLPAGDAPGAGWPVVLAFQGSYVGAANMWHGRAGEAFGALFQADTIAALIDQGYAVLTPETKLAGTTFWDTNVPPFSSDWQSSSDHQLMVALFAAINDGTFGPLDTKRLYAMGISSGGYMTSRMAISYPGTFRALAIVAGSFATCAGPVCEVPLPLPSDHPPTLFLHGEKDLVVPLKSMTLYRDGLNDRGVATQTIIGPEQGHEWPPESPAAIPAFFTSH